MIKMSKTILQRKYLESRNERNWKDSGIVISHCRPWDVPFTFEHPQKKNS